MDSNLYFPRLKRLVKLILEEKKDFNGSVTSFVDYIIKEYECVEDKELIIKALDYIYLGE